VGMDVVRRNIHDLGGVVEVKSESGKGSTFTIRLPLTLAIVDGQLVRVGDQIYIIPLISIIESLQIKSENVKTGAGQTELYRLREDYIPMVRLHNIFHTKSDSTQLDDGLLVVVEAEGQKVGFFVDDLLAQHQVVVKSLESNYQRVVGVSGATILGDGTVAMILDISGLINLSRPDPDGTHINNFEQHQAA
jgi:two-component system, chemotaxis family, sensor kinase CheA